MNPTYWQQRVNALPLSSFSNSVTALVLEAYRQGFNEGIKAKEVQEVKASWEADEPRLHENLS
jgi:hypothetical protein